MCLTVVGMVILSQCQGYICYCKGHGECVVHVLWIHNYHSILRKEHQTYLLI